MKNEKKAKTDLSVKDIFADNIYGVDFSGATDAGRKIWIARGEIKKESFHIKECFKASNLVDSNVERDKCFNAFYKFMSTKENAIFGMDFPFSLSKSMMKQKNWKDFAITFNSVYHDPKEFREKCRKITGGLELKRQTEMETKTPFSSYNLRIYRQTFYGISRILSPLVKNKKACVLPMQKPDRKKNWIIEVCPASLLKRIGLYIPYKGKTEKHINARLKIIKAICNKSCVITKEVNASALNDHNGDALDSILAAIATFRAITNSETLETKDRCYAIEGYVYS